MEAGAQLQFRARLMDKRHLKRNGPICYRCGGMKHRRRKSDGIRFCPRVGEMNVVRRMTYAERAIICERVRKVRFQVERKSAWRSGIMDWLQTIFQQMTGRTWAA
jgi:hypothetical protein